MARKNESEVRYGRVVWFSKEKGYGFIAPDDGTKEIFVHHTGIKMLGFKTLVKDEPVSFIVEEGKKGPQATNVTRLNNESTNQDQSASDKS